jgi:hypothetical protein
MSAGCFLCGENEVSPLSHRGSPVCEGCLPIKDHVVSMQTASGGGSLAVCQCGWRSTVRGDHRYVLQDTKVRLHWREAIRRAMADFDALHGRGAAVRDFALGLLACTVLTLNVVAIAALTGGGT